MINLQALLSVVTILVYFGISMFVPFLGYLVPYYKITKVNIYGRRYRTLINLAVALILYILNFRVLIIYLLFPFMTEFLFYLTVRYASKLKVYDKLLIITFISTVIIFCVFYINKDTIFYNLDRVIEMRTVQMDISNIKATISYIKENPPTAIFSFLFLGNIFLFLALDSKSYGNWKISCYWLIPFIFVIILKNIPSFDFKFNFFIENNVIGITKYIYTWYGIKIIYSFIEKLGIKINILKHLCSFILGVLYPIPVFILGALFSFDIVEIKTIKI